MNEGETTTDVSAGIGESQQVDQAAEAADAQSIPQQGIGEEAPSEGPSKDWFGAPGDGYSADGIELPDGYELDDTVAENLAGVCQKMGLSQRAFSEIVNKMTPVLEARQNAAVEQFRENNLKAFYADKQLGGANAKATIEAANKAYMNLVPEGLQDIFKRSGLNTHPDMIRMFHSISQRMSDDKVVRGGRASEAPSLANFFNNSKMN